MAMATTAWSTRVVFLSDAAAVRSELGSDPVSGADAKLVSNSFPTMPDPLAWPACSE